MLYDAKLLTIYEVENGYVVECVEDAEGKGGKETAPVTSETKSYTADTAAKVLKIVREALKDDEAEDKGKTTSEYDDGFKEATAKK